VQVVASPYGLLSPRVFQNALSRGIVANTFTAVNHALAPDPVRFPFALCVCCLVHYDVRITCVVNLPLFFACAWFICI
jgi:hypothetical protein